MTVVSRACVSPNLYSIETMSVSRTVSEIFSVKEWSDLETVGRSFKVISWYTEKNEIRTEFHGGI